MVCWEKLFIFVFGNIIFSIITSIFKIIINYLYGMYCSADLYYNDLPDEDENAKVILTIFCWVA